MAAILSGTAGRMGEFAQQAPDVRGAFANASGFSLASRLVGTTLTAALLDRLLHHARSSRSSRRSSFVRSIIAIAHKLLRTTRGSCARANTSPRSEPVRSSEGSMSCQFRQAALLHRSGQCRAEFAAGAVRASSLAAAGKGGVPLVELQIAGHDQDAAFVERGDHLEE